MSMSKTDIPLANNVTMALGNSTVVASSPWAAAVPGIENPNTINGVIPDGVPVEAESSRVLAASISPNTPTGNLTIVYRDIRSPGSRSPNHIHRYGGVTCVHQGTMKLYVEGQEDVIAEAGSCYSMPAMTKVSALNIGNTVSILNDIFIGVPCGEPVITFIEDCCRDLNVANSYAMYAPFEDGAMMPTCEEIVYFNPELKQLSAFMIPQDSGSKSFGLTMIPFILSCFAMCKLFVMS